MSMLQIATYVSYIFIIVAYTVKVMKILRMPPNLRWELYPIPHEKAYRYGGSYMEEAEWWKKQRKKNPLRSIVHMLKAYFLFSGYFFKNIKYWVTLYPWHVGFYLIVFFHVLSFFGALIIVRTGIPIAPASSGLGSMMYYLTLVAAVSSFVLGSIGSIGLLIMRLVDKGLKNYASPVNYFNYIFFLIVFMSGFVSWFFFDPTLSEYREYWISLITFKAASVHLATYVHVMLFSLFLIYLPFTRSTHYIIQLIAFFGVLWDDSPNKAKSKREAKIKELLEKPVNWSASHIQSGKKWSEVVTVLPEITAGQGRNK